MNKAALLSAVILAISLQAFAQPFAKWSNKSLTLNNGIVERVIALPEGSGKFVTTTYKPVSGPFNYFDTASTDFQFEVNGQVYSGMDNWMLNKVDKYTDATGGDGATVTLTSYDGKLQVAIQFLLYPNLPVIRKNLTVTNLGSETIQLESVDVEKFNVSSYWAPTFSWVCHDYGRRRSVGPYDGNMQDALVTVHNSDWQQGIVMGNEASGVIKHTSAFWEGLTICIGVTHKDALFPFRKYIAKGETFITPQVFTMVYNNKSDPDEMLNTAVPAFVNKHLGIRLSVLKQKPTFVYNTWKPFETNINEKLIMELAKAAATAGMKEFVIDDGWQENYGDWVIDKQKFPHGLKPVFDYIKSLGMKPGLWVSIGSASTTSNVYRQHPDWFVKDKDGKASSIQWVGDTTKLTACFSTGWYGYIKDVLMKLSLEYGLEYMKLDFAVVTSPYRYNHDISGCYATDHPGHKDHNESLYTNYEQVWKLFDELHAAKPDVFIDCTFEAMGGIQLIDYAMLKHAEGNWLSNFTATGSKVDLRIRNMSWWRSPAIPATALVIGNPEMQDTGWAMHIKSLAGALPIMLGDPRKLSVADLATYHGFANWMQQMETRYGIMAYRQDLPGFGEPMEGMWDGFQRMNTDSKKGGIVGVFRQGAIDTKKLVILRGLDAAKTYQVKQMDGKIITSQTGKDLTTKGFYVSLYKTYDGQLFEISAQ